MRTWKIDGPPEIVDGMVMNVMTSCSLRPANRARKPPMAWMPSCELPAIRMIASEMRDILGEPPDGGAVNVDSLMDKSFLINFSDGATPFKVDCCPASDTSPSHRSEEHTSELQS